MTATCVVRRLNGTTLTEDFEVVPNYDVLYLGRCKSQTFEGYEQTSESAGATVTVQRSSVHFPVGAFRTAPGDVVTVVSSTDPLLVGKSMRIVQDYPVKEHATAYRVFVDENVGQEVPPWTG